MFIKTLDSVQCARDRRNTTNLPGKSAFNKEDVDNVSVFYLYYDIKAKCEIFILSLKFDEMEIRMRFAIRLC